MLSVLPFNFVQIFCILFYDLWVSVGLASVSKGSAVMFNIFLCVSH
jgi:hypothetical protein